MDCKCSLPGSSVYGIFQARVLEWAACEILREIFLIQESNRGGSILHTDSLPYEPPGKPLEYNFSINKFYHPLILSIFSTTLLFTPHLLIFPHSPFIFSYLYWFQMFRVGFGGQAINKWSISWRSHTHQMDHLSNIQREERGWKSTVGAQEGTSGSCTQGTESRKLRTSLWMLGS